MTVSVSRSFKRVEKLIGSPGDSMGISTRGVRFVLAGGTVAVYYLTSTSVLANVVGLPFEVALIIGFLSAICLHFTLQRFFVWVHADDFALPVHHQLLRYLVVVGSQYGITALATGFLPAALGVPTEVVYLITASLLAVTNFLVMGSRVFHGEGSSQPAGIDVEPAGVDPA